MYSPIMYFSTLLSRVSKEIEVRHLQTASDNMGVALDRRQIAISLSEILHVRKICAFTANA